MSRSKHNKQSERIRPLVEQHLRGAGARFGAASIGPHLDEDALNAFVEGRISDLESPRLLRHIVNCGSCRRITAQLIRLDSDLAGDAPSIEPSVQEPGRIKRLLADLASRVIPGSEGDAVLAYHAPADDFEEKEKDNDADDSSGEEQS